MLAKTIIADTIYMYEKYIAENNTSFAILKASAITPTYLQALKNNELLQHIDLVDFLGDWLRPLQSGVIISGTLQDFSVAWQEKLASIGLKYFTFIPITQHGKLHNLLCIYHFATTYTVTPAEINLFNVILQQFTAFLYKRNSEKKLLSYKKMFEESNLNVFVLDAKGYHLESNFAYRQLIGYDTDEELKAFTPEILFGKSFYQWFEQLKKQGYYYGEISIDAMAVVLELSSYVVQNETGEVMSYINIATNITQRIAKDKELQNLVKDYQIVNENLRNNENKLLKSEQQLRMLAENSFEMILLSTPDGMITYVSSSAEKITGYQKEELLGKYLIEFFHPDDLDAIQIQSQQQISSKSKDIVLTHRFLTKNNVYIWLESFTKYIYDRDGNVSNLQTSSRDVTQNILANKALKNSEEKFRNLFNKTYDAIFLYQIVANSYSKFIEVNEVACKLLGYVKEELLELSFENLLQFPKDLRIATGNENYYFQTTFIDKQQKQIPVEVAITYIPNDVDFVIQAVVRDITEKKRAEESTKAKELAERLLKIKTDFLANMSHEIRTPMNGILGMTHFLIQTPLNDKQKQYAETVKKSAENLLVILNDVLDLSKLEANKMQLKPKVFNLQHTITQLKGLFESALLQKNITFLETWHTTVSPWIVADESRLLQVMTNLISNAIKFTTFGHISIHISMEKMDTDNIKEVKEMKEIKEIKETVKYPKFKIEIIDTGTGIQEEHQNLLFEKFYQIDTDKNIKQQGTGLGLSICKQFVELWNGEIGVKSMVDKGSNFWFTIPVVFASEQEIAIASKSQNQDAEDIVLFENLRVLVAEDIFVNQEVAKTMIEQLGGMVEVVNNGQEAIEAVAKTAYDLVLIDIQMPIMNGIVATKYIKKELKNIPIIIGLSANVLGEDAKNYIQEGMDDYISKPIEPYLLQKKLAKWFPNKIKKESNFQKSKAITSIENNKNAEIYAVEIINPKTINKLLSLIKNNKTRLDILLQSFYEDMENLLIDTKQAIINKENKNIISYIHTIKGLSGTMGLSILFVYANNLYRNLQEGNFKQIAENVETMEKLYTEAKVELNKISMNLGIT
jgi:PAS domain S-box-containing protein